MVVDKGIPLIPDVRTDGADGGKRHGDSAVAIFLAYLASRAENQIYELHRIAKVGAPAKDNDGQRQMNMTRGLRNGGGLL